VAWKSARRSIFFDGSLANDVEVRYELGQLTSAVLLVFKEEKPMGVMLKTFSKIDSFRIKF
jgi:hypothetical protein